MISSKRTFYSALEVGTSALLVLIVWVYLSGDRGYAWVSVPTMLEAFKDAWLFDRLWSDIVPSLLRLTLGFIAAVLIGITFGTALGISRTIRLTTLPVVSFLRSIPAVALLPLSIVLLGIGTTQKVSIIAFVCCWPIVLNTADGIASLDTTMMMTAKSYRLTRFEQIRLVILPGIVPRIFAGMRVSISLAVLLLVTSEMVAATSGIGFFIWQAQLTFSIADMWAGIILLGLLGYTLNAVFSLLEKRLCRWNTNMKGN
jgi:ABC-type nitrate/sulfonate/bicarbonate transport system permease component